MGGGAVGAPAKQFLPLAGAPLIIHTLRQFEECPDIDAVLPVLPAAEIAAGNFTRLCQEQKLAKTLAPVAGAAERQESVFCGLQALAADPSLHEKIAVVAIHDAVRPLITPDIISATVRAAAAQGAAICALAATDTIKEVAQGKIVRTLPRAQIYMAQTPQAFHYRLILDAHQRAAAEQFVATDDAMLIERLGGAVAIVEGSPDNIKITKPADFALAELILARRRQQETAG